MTSPQSLAKRNLIRQDPILQKKLATLLEGVKQTKQRADKAKGHIYTLGDETE